MMVIVMTQPEITKKMSTPVLPAATPKICEASTNNIDIALSPSMSGRYVLE